MPDPSTISGLMLWFEAKDIPTLVHGDPIVTWPDKSGNGHDLTQGTAAKRPTFWNDPNLPMIGARFDGTDDYMATASFPSPTAGFNVFVVARLTIGGEDGVHRKFISHSTTVGWSAPYARYAMHAFGVSPFGLEVWAEAYGGAVQVHEPTELYIDTYRFVCYEMYYDLTTLATFQNLGFTSGVVAAGSLTSSNAPVYVGANGIGSESFFGDMASIVVYDRMLTTEERGEVVSYLMAGDAPEMLGVTQSGIST